VQGKPGLGNGEITCWRSWQTLSARQSEVNYGHGATSHRDAFRICNCPRGLAFPWV
jgi:hypothetical protein